MLDATHRKVNSQRILYMKLGGITLVLEKSQNYAAEKQQKSANKSAHRFELQGARGCRPRSKCRSASGGVWSTAIKLRQRNRDRRKLKGSIHKILVQPPQWPGLRLGTKRKRGQRIGDDRGRRNYVRGHRLMVCAGPEPLQKT